MQLGVVRVFCVLFLMSVFGASQRGGETAEPLALSAERSVVAGDSAYVFTFEYRFHVPRLFKPQPPTKLPLEEARPFGGRRSRSTAGPIGTWSCGASSTAAA